MAKDVYIYSTLSASQKYTTYKEGPGGLPVPVSSVFVQGGANVADRRLITPKGVVTKVTAEQFEMLKRDAVFAIHLENGYITTSTSKEDADVVAEDLTARDGSAPTIESDYEPGKAPIAADADVDDPPAPQTGVAATQRTPSRRA